MTQGLNITELKARLQVETLKDYILMDVEGEILFYHRERDKELIKLYKKRVIDFLCLKYLEAD